MRVEVVSCHRKKIFGQRKCRLRRMIADRGRAAIAAGDQSGERKPRHMGSVS
jgi:hypothetical protein